MSTAWSLFLHHIIAHVFDRCQIFIYKTQIKYNFIEKMKFTTLQIYKHPPCVYLQWIEKILPTMHQNVKLQTGLYEQDGHVDIKQVAWGRKRKKVKGKKSDRNNSAKREKKRQKMTCLGKSRITGRGETVRIQWCNTDFINV